MPDYASRGAISNVNSWSQMRTRSPWASVAAENAFAAHVDTVGGPQIADHETRTGVDDDGVMATDVGVVEHDVVVGEPPDPGGGGLQRWASLQEL